MRRRRRDLAGLTIDLGVQTDAAGFTITGSGFADTITGSQAADTIYARRGQRHDRRFCRR